MLTTTRPKAKTLFMRLLRRLPLPLLSLFIGLVVGLAVWGFLDRSQRAAVRRLFNQELQLRLDQRSRENLIRFDQYLDSYAATTRLLANHRRLALYLEPLFWSLDEPVEPQRYEGFRPYWLPDLISNTLTPPSHVLLVDTKGTLREIYSAGHQPLPKELSRGLGSQFLDASRVRTLLTRFGDRPYLVVSDAADDASGFSMGFLVLLIPIDARFLTASQQGGHTSGDLVAVIDADDQRILTSSDPSILLPSTQVQQWTDEYLVTSQSFSEYEGMDWNVMFATFLSHEMVSTMSGRVRRLEERQRTISALVFISVFTLAIYLVSLRLNRVLRRISHFSERALGFRPVERRTPTGNQLLLLEDQVSRFIRLVLLARAEMRRRHAREIRQTEALKSAILQASLDSIITIDGAGHIIEFNPTAERAFGYRREEVLGRSFTGLLLRAESVPQFQALLQECRDGSPEEAHRHLCSELEAVTADTTPMPVEISIVPIPLAGFMVYTVYLHDITNRKEAERTIQSLAKFASESPSPVLRVSANGIILYANAASQPLLDYWNCQVDQPLPPFWGQRVRWVLEEGHPAEWEVVCSTQVYSLLFAPVGDLGYVNLYGRDVTAVRRAEQEARQHQAELVHVCRLSTMGEMATGMAHEINQPLSAIVNYANGCSRRLRGGGSETAELVEAMGQIAAQGQRASAIIRRLRQMVGKQPPMCGSLDMNQAVREVYSFIEFDAGRRGVTVELDLWEKPLPIRADLVQIEQVLLNLLRNALDALLQIPTEQRRVRVYTRPWAGRQVQVEVRDWGPGIERATQEHLFEPFFTTKETGMGMGLPISKTIMEGHGGKIWCESHPEGGASFFLLLPGLWSQGPPMQTQGKCG